MTWTPIRLSSADPNSRIIYRRLLLTKRLFLHALQHYHQSDTDIDMMVATHNFHNALEVFLKTIWSAYAVKLDPKEKTRDPNFETLIRTIDSFLTDNEGPSLPYPQELININRIRNQVQHQALEPSRPALEEVRYHTEQFLKKGYKDYFGVEFLEVSLIELVDDKLLQGLLSCAKSLLGSLDFGRALTYTRIAVDLALESLKPDDSRFSSLASLAWELFEGNEYGIGILFATLSSHLSDLENEISMISLGLKSQDFREFLSLVPSVSIKQDQIDVHWDHHPDESKATQALDLAATIIVNLQDLGEKPCVVKKTQERVQTLISPDVTIGFVDKFSSPPKPTDPI